MIKRTCDLYESLIFIYFICKTMMSILIIITILFIVQSSCGPLLLYICISIIGIIILFITPIFIFIIYQKYKKNYITFDFEKDYFSYKYLVYKISDIKSIKYYKNKWYYYIFPLIWYYNGGGLLEIKTKDFQKIYERVFWKEFIKLKEIVIDCEII